MGYKTPKLSEPHTVIDAQEQGARERLANLLAPAQQMALDHELERAYTKQMSAQTLETRINAMLENNVSFSEVPNGVRALVNEPQGDWAHALSEGDATEISRIAFQQGWDGGMER